jgi:hypothetical protein
VTLLEIAKSLPIDEKKKRAHALDYEPEEVELAIAWAKGEVALLQAQRALQIRNSSTTIHVLAYALRVAIRQGKLVRV